MIGAMITFFPVEKKGPHANILRIMSESNDLLDHLREQGKGR